jgi:secretion/DNA translocation related TadE-like protein
VLMLALISVGIALLVGLGTVGSALIAQERLDGIADLAALAAAGASGTPECDRAARVAVLGRANLASCEVRTDLSVAVVVSRNLGPWRVSARSRAGRVNLRSEP